MFLTIVFICLPASARNSDTVLVGFGLYECRILATEIIQKISSSISRYKLHFKMSL